MSARLEQVNIKAKEFENLCSKIRQSGKLRSEHVSSFNELSDLWKKTPFSLSKSESLIQDFKNQEKYYIKDDFLVELREFRRICNDYYTEKDCFEAFSRAMGKDLGSTSVVVAPTAKPILTATYGDGDREYSELVRREKERQERTTNEAISRATPSMSSEERYRSLQRERQEKERLERVSNQSPKEGDSAIFLIVGLVFIIIITMLGLLLSGHIGYGTHSSTNNWTTSGTSVNYTISYDLAGGTVWNPTNFTVESSAFTLIHPVREGHTFTGWTGSNGTTPQMSVTIPQGSTGDRHFTANWRQNTSASRHRNGDKRTITRGGTSIEAVFVEHGVFIQGGERFGNHTSRQVTITRGFWISRFPITQAQYQAVMGNNPSYFSGRPSNPVERVDWYSAAEFARRVHGRLPREAEWEFAARGGTQSNRFIYSGSNYENDVAWHQGNSNRGTHPVGRLRGNELGIHDMSGNVWEWVSDLWWDYNTTARTDPTGPSDGYLRVIRGGSWGIGSHACRVAIRSQNSPSVRHGDIGFRVVF
jgi:uncharacterized repeat protein (TIGR02543 family)